ncbi:chitooligosaccharidolytic beta-N-acetylglucosaminidase-like [Bradysia coprophila]|uniref:chitooligosaccharidolytic beta-N-acetylglucosaminidase-like n=1 Tax=Bradysia coprophila TaxID=38358 RepID=UPI00187DC88A|nr:chitooligosaccharidolytic beta-N-acetylglucosaminidase-like [Bradysia coprophila]
MKRIFSVENILCYIVSTLLIGAVVAVIVIVSTTTEPKNYAIKIPVWAYKCESNKCVKVKYDENTAENMSFSWCRQTCMDPNETSVWPSVQQQRLDASKYIKINSIRFRENNSRNVKNNFWTDNFNRFYRQLNYKRSKLTELSPGDFDVFVDINVTDLENTNLTMDTTESYSLQTSEENGSVRIMISSETVFGARYALETLVQIIFYDDFSNTLVIHCGITITDGPVYKHRGISLDTSRNFISKESIKRNIDTMSMVKLNVFHWHITDSHSWPMSIKSHSYLSDYGAYDETKVYTADDIAEIVNYAYNRGVRVIPELDAPAHVGEGWQFTELTTCFGIQPWQNFCYEPPCGQFNPTVDRLYDVLDDIYREMNEMFNYPDFFHMGGDEVHFKCWESSANLTTWMVNRGWNLDDDGYMQLWSYFQNKALERLDKWARDDTNIILFTSTLTEPKYLHYLDNSRYVIQVWSNLDDPSVLNLLENNFKIIVSNSDVMYLDCGYESWTATGNNWCSPYSGWQEIYANDFKTFDAYKSQILGGEILLWTEQADDSALDGRLWPRGIALAERLWSDSSRTYRAIEPKMLLQRQRFVQNGISSEQLQPEWCLQNQGECPLI